MKTNIQFILLVLCIMMALSAQEVHVDVQDDLGNPVSNAEVTAGFDNPKKPERYDKQVQFTDTTGSVAFRGDALLGISLWVKKDGYYWHSHYPAEPDVIPKSRLENHLQRTITLRRVLEPIPLYVRTNGGGKIPEENQWVGYDLQNGDWVAPHGKGKVVDILFRVKREFLGIYVSPYNPTSVECQRRNESGVILPV